MPTGPKGERRPADPIANAVHVMRVATGETEETYVHQGKAAGGRKGGKSRTDGMSAERRVEIARMGATARWNGCDTVGEGQPGSPAARQPGSPAARQPGSPAARQPGSPAARQPGSPD